MKKMLKIMAGLLLVLILFRGPIYRLSFVYHPIGSQEEIKITNQELLDIIELEYRNTEIDWQSISNIAHRITIKTLHFSTAEVSTNPNDLVQTSVTNCIGYAAMFNSIANYLINAKKLEDQMKAFHIRAHIYFLGINLHQYLDHPFLANHDINIMKNLKTNETIAIDPSLSDYLFIKKVSTSMDDISY